MFNIFYCLKCHPQSPEGHIYISTSGKCVGCNSMGSEVTPKGIKACEGDVVVVKMRDGNEILGVIKNFGGNVFDGENYGYRIQDMNGINIDPYSADSIYVSRGWESDRPVYYISHNCIRLATQDEQDKFYLERFKDV